MIAVKEVEPSWSLELDVLEKAVERYGVRRVISEILDYIRAIALDVLPRKQ